MSEQVRKLFWALIITFSFSLFAQEAGLYNPDDVSGLVDSEPADSASGDSNTAPKDLSQNYLAKSATPVNAVVAVVVGAIPDTKPRKLSELASANA